MSEQDTATVESTDIQPRTRRALERVYTVLHTDGTPISDDETPTVVSVVSGNSGREHRVDVRDERCTCEDHEYRGVECAHIRRARFALGRQSLDTDTLAACDVHERFAEHAPGPAVVASDGGSAEFTERADHLAAKVEERVGERVRVPVSGGVLVYEREVHGKSLVGFESVTDWSALGDAVAARGHSRGDVLHLPELDTDGE